MRAKVLEVAWHESAPIWSIDFSAQNRLVTAGGDKVARIWHLSSTPSNTHTAAPSTVSTPRASPQVEWQCDLRAHTTTVNTARFSQSGFSVATGADGGEIVIWHFEPNAQPFVTPFDAASSGADAPQPRERWVRHATLRGHVQDVLDLSWSSDGTKLVSASIDNSVQVWDVDNPSRPSATLRNHTNFVQGVAIDPFSRLIASLGNDRSLRIFSHHSMGASRWSQVASVSAASDARLFVDDAKFKNFFRRLTWSPDGSVLACPSGIQIPQTKRLFAVHLFARGRWAGPAAQCAWLPKPACAVRFSPVLYSLRGENSLHAISPTESGERASQSPPRQMPQPQLESTTPVQECSQPTSRMTSQAVSIATEQESSKPSSQSPPLRDALTHSPNNSHGQIDLRLPAVEVSSAGQGNPFSSFSYRMIFAVACVDAIFFYDTESFTRPFAKVEGLHCAEHTDISWSSDGLQLAVSSVDGYASVITFTKEELGCSLPADKLPPWLAPEGTMRELVVEKKASNVGREVHVATGSLDVTDLADRNCMPPPERGDLGPISEGGGASLLGPDCLKATVARSEGTICRTMKQGIPKLAGAAPNCVPTQQIVSAGLPQATLKHNGNHGYRITAHQPAAVVAAEKDVSNTDAIIVQPKRRIKPTPIVQSVLTSENKELCKQMDLEGPVPKDSGRLSNSLHIANNAAPNVTNITPKRRNRTTAFVQSVITCVPREKKVDVAPEAAEKDDFVLLVDEGNGSAEKRRKGDCATPVDLI